MTPLAMVDKLGIVGFHLSCNKYFGWFSHVHLSKNSLHVVYLSYFRSSDNANIQKTDHHLIY